MVTSKTNDEPQSMRNTIQQHHFNVSLKAFKIKPFCNETKLEQLSQTEMTTTTITPTLATKATRKWLKEH